MEENRESIGPSQSVLLFPEICLGHALERPLERPLERFEWQFRHQSDDPIRLQDLETLSRRDTTQIYTMIRPSHLKRVVSFYEEPARRMLTS